MRTLGLDLGPNSIGWALVETTPEGEPIGIAALGSRIFEQVTDPQSQAPKNQARRVARAARRRNFRRRMRRQHVLALLVRYGLLPEDEKERFQILHDHRAFDPYQLRRKGLDEALTPYELGRALFHINARRGFRSNRRIQFAGFAANPEVATLIEANEQTADNEEEGVNLARIQSFRRQIAESGYRTAGEFLSHRHRKRRDFLIERQMLDSEFELLCNAQSRYNPEILSPDRVAALKNAIFFQRPLKSQKFLVGRCRLEPSRRRAAKARLEFQRFRLLQTVNHLEVRDPQTRVWRPLRPEERAALVGTLENQSSLTWAKARRLIGIHRGEKFNLEVEEDAKLYGDSTTAFFRKHASDQWDALDREQRLRLLDDLITIRTKDALFRRLRTFWKLPVGVAFALTVNELEGGYASYSSRAIRRILPSLEEGMNLYDACAAAGYARAGTTTKVESSTLGEPNQIRNPVVKKCLYESRRLVNAICRNYGRPDLIRIELTRELKMTPKEKRRALKIARENERLNDRAREAAATVGVLAPSADDLLKYRLWEELKHVCPYTGTTIGLHELFSPEVEIEHILPYSRSLDDSYMNKTLCLTAFNRNIKKNRTPFEALQSDPAAFAILLQRIGRESLPDFPETKRKRFEVKDIDLDKSITRQLSDTRYISTEVRTYLLQLGVPVEVTKGEATASLRYRWALNRILTNDGSNSKNRLDHRHHAIDAVVIALTSRGLFQKLSQLSSRTAGSLRDRGFALSVPWPTFFADVQKQVQAMVVSHAATRRIRGPLHEANPFGKCAQSGKFVRRAPLNEKFSIRDVPNIRDAAIRRLVEARISQVNGDMAKAFNTPLIIGSQEVRRVRIAFVKNDATVFAVGSPATQFYALGKNHHLELIQNNTTGKRTARIVSMCLAAERARRSRAPIVDRTAADGSSFVMSLCLNDIVRLEDDGKMYRVQSIEADKRVTLREVHSNHPERDVCSRREVVTRLAITKWAVDVLGRLERCND